MGKLGASWRNTSTSNRAKRTCPCVAKPVANLGQDRSSCAPSHCTPCTVSNDMSFTANCHCCAAPGSSPPSKVKRACKRLNSNGLSAGVAGCRHTTPTSVSATSLVNVLSCAPRPHSSQPRQAILAVWIAMTSEACGHRRVNMPCTAAPSSCGHWAYAKPSQSRQFPACVLNSGESNSACRDTRWPNSGGGVKSIRTSWLRAPLRKTASTCLKSHTEDAVVCASTSDVGAKPAWS